MPRNGVHGWRSAVEKLVVLVTSPEEPYFVLEAVMPIVEEVPADHGDRPAERPLAEIDEPMRPREAGEGVHGRVDGRDEEHRADAHREARGRVAAIGIAEDVGAARAHAPQDRRLQDEREEKERDRVERRIGDVGHGRLQGMPASIHATMRSRVTSLGFGFVPAASLIGNCFGAGEAPQPDCIVLATPQRMSAASVFTSASLS